MGGPLGGIPRPWGSRKGLGPFPLNPFGLLPKFLDKLQSGILEIDGIPQWGCLVCPPRVEKIMGTLRTLHPKPIHLLLMPQCLSLQQRISLDKGPSPLDLKVIVPLFISHPH